MNKSDSIAALAAALAKAQAEMPGAPMTSVNPFLKNKYADLGSVIKTAAPVLARHGLSTSQLVEGDGVTVSVTTILMHASGEYLSSTISLSMAEERGKSAAQVAGSIVTYLRRYALAAILGMYADEDSDGNEPKRQQRTQGDKPAADPAAIEYPPELAVVTNREGEHYIDLPTDKLSHMANSIRNTMGKTTDEDEKAQLAMKLDAIREILKIRNGQ